MIVSVRGSQIVSGGASRQWRRPGAYDGISTTKIAKKLNSSSQAHQPFTLTQPLAVQRWSLVRCW